MISRVGKVAYRLELTDELNQLHSSFHVSQLRKGLVDDTTLVPLDDIQIDKRVNYLERTIVILDKKMKTFLRKVVPLVKLY